MKKIIFMLTAVALMASCSKGESPEIDDQKPVEGRNITARSAHQQVNGTLTRVPYIGNISNENQLPARVITFNGPLKGSVDTDPNANKTLCDGNFQFTARATVTAYDFANFTTGDGKYQAIEDQYDTYNMVGLYPQGTWVGNAEQVDNVLTHAITGCADIMVAEMQEITKDEVASSTPPTLVFRHQLTKFEVKVKAKDAAAEGVWDKITEIKLTNLVHYDGAMPNTFSYTLNDDAAKTYTDEEDENAPLYFFGIDNTKAELDKYTETNYAGADGSILAETNEDFNPATVAYTMSAAFVPVLDKDVTIVVKALTKGDPVEEEEFIINIPLPPLGQDAQGADITSAGYAYSISLTFSDKLSIIADAEVIDWADGGETDHILM